MGRPSLAEQRRVEICRALQSCVIRNGSYEMTSVKDIAQEVWPPECCITILRARMIFCW